MAKSSMAGMAALDPTAGMRLPLVNGPAKMGGKMLQSLRAKLGEPASAHVKFVALEGILWMLGSLTLGLLGDQQRKSMARQDMLMQAQLQGAQMPTGGMIGNQAIIQALMGRVAPQAVQANAMVESAKAQAQPGREQLMAALMQQGAGGLGLASNEMSVGG